VKKRVRVIVSGDVQGVGFRWYCREEAMGRDLTGLVRNLPDGRVEAEFEGEDSNVEAMVEWCGRGPAWARVERLEAEELPPTGDMEFRITH
jgi:acylphosphatase